VKAAQPFNLYVLEGTEQAALGRALAGIGLEVKPLPDRLAPERPALIVLGEGQQAPPGLDDIAISPPPGTAGPALRELIRMAIENVTLKQEVVQLKERASHQHTQFDELNRIGIALSAERDIDKLQDLILLTMRQLTNADGASLWLRTDDDGAPQLFLASSQNNSLGDTYQKFKVALDDKSVVGYAVTSNASLIYDDAYTPPPGKPRGGRGFDAQFHYRTKSMLTVPMRDYRDEVVGAIQLINAKRHFATKLTLDTVEAEVVSFRPDDLKMIESIASQAATALDNKTLLKSIQAMFDGLIEASVTAVEERDPTTYGHSKRVEALTTRLARVVSDLRTGKYGDVHLTEDQFQELRYACLLHDFGKVGVREHILIKAKKLPLRQLDVIQSRFEYVERSFQMKHAMEKLEAFRAGATDGHILDEIDAGLQQEINRLDRWMNAIIQANEPTVLPEDKASALEEVAQQIYYDMDDKPHPMLEPEEFKFLSIRKGSLDSEERRAIEEHVTKSFTILAKIPWSSVKMKGVPEIAYGHHEFLDGSGYPRGLVGDQIPLQARMMTIADIYDALTAMDRPYKRAVTTSAALDILNQEADQGKLDKDLLDVFVEKEVYRATASR